ncbi:MAG: tripartite tricarboxylate transporter TctB family protein [Treponema sp.]|nr:tripartite tricarboxylate transporter TctB family protein [Treponema sp.]
MTPKADFFAGTGILVFAGIMFNIARNMPAPATFGLGPGGYPMLVTGVLMLLGSILAVQGWLGMRRLSRSGEEAGQKSITFKELGGIAILALSFWAYVFLMRYLGYLITTPIFLFLFLFQYGARKWKQMILICIISTGLSWFLFNYVFYVILPDFYFRW